MNELSMGYFRGEWVPRESMRLSVDDVGFRSGVTAVERLRTYDRRVFELSEHLQRWERTIAELAIQGLPTTDQIADQIDELLDRNQAILSRKGDTGITIFATPGELAGPSPTFGLHLN